METQLRTELTGIAERLAGGRVYVDVLYSVSPAENCLEVATGDTAEIALARFIARILEEQAEAKEKEEPGPPAPAIQAPAPAMAISANENDGQEPAAPWKRRSRQAFGEDVIAHVRANAHKTAKEIGGELGIPATTIAPYLTRVRKELASRQAEEATFPANGTAGDRGG